MLYVLAFTTNDEVRKEFGVDYGYSLFNEKIITLIRPLHIQQNERMVFTAADGSGFVIAPKYMRKEGSRLVILTERNTYIINEMKQYQ